MPLSGYPPKAATTTARDRFAGLLDEVAAPGQFSASHAVAPDDLRLEVRGVGPVHFPVPANLAEQLRALGRPARFGRGEQTLLDPKVRDTCEIPRGRIKIEKRQWNATLRSVLDRLRADLGLAAGCRLTAEFHAMLVYGPGQFFAPHQDSEKNDAMIGTLVVTLPSEVTGGDLVVEHAGATETYWSSNTALSFVAFYADCRHQVRPVRSGYRVVLTYNLLLDGDPAGSPAGQEDPALTADLAGCLDAHFTTRVPARYGSADADPPTRLVYLLDHEYTERGLSWARLKGRDAGRAATVRAAAAAAECEVVLALAEVHETWSADDPEEPTRRRGRRRYWEDDEEDQPARRRSPESYELVELLDSSITLDRWLDPPEGPPTRISLTVSDAEVCATTPSAALSPYASEYEGYMGNYGNTMDRWYRRAALVVWPRHLGFAQRGEASPRWALDTLAGLVRSGDVVGAGQLAATLAPTWNAVAGGERARKLLKRALPVARGLDEPEIAAMLLAPFRLEMLSRGRAAALADLVAGYGEAWAREVVAVWSGLDFRSRPPSGDRDRLAWLESLPSLCEALCAVSDAGVSMARILLARSWSWLGASVDHYVRLAQPPRLREYTLGQLGPAVAAMFASVAVARADDVRDEAVRFLCHENDHVLACLMPALRAAESLPPDAVRYSRLDAIARHCAARLEARLARPPRAAGDWSVQPPADCSCRLCGTLGSFLADPARRTFEWPLAKQDRHHVHAAIDDSELPVLHQTRRAGRPYTLVLTKTEAIFEREHLARQRDEADLAWLAAAGSW